MRWMPLMTKDRVQIAIPMGLLDERQAQVNHGQTLERLAERGGLCEAEAFALIYRKKLREVDLGMTLAELLPHLVPGAVKRDLPAC